MTIFTKARFMASAALALTTLASPALAGDAALSTEGLQHLAETAVHVQERRTPVKVGIARIEDGHIGIATYEELESWANFSWQNQDGAADIHMISPVAVAQQTPKSVANLRDVDNPIDLIRLAAIDQGLDYVLLYDTGNGTAATPLARTSFRAMGITGWEAPDTDRAQSAKVLLVDVYEGYLRGTAEIAPDAQTLDRLMDAAGALMDTLEPPSQYAAL